MFSPCHWLLSHITIVETMDGGERGMNPFTMNVINLRKEYSPDFLRAIFRSITKSASAITPYCTNWSMKRFFSNKSEQTTFRIFPLIQVESYKNLVYLHQHNRCKSNLTFFFSQYDFPVDLSRLLLNIETILGDPHGPEVSAVWSYRRS